MRIAAFFIVSCVVVTCRTKPYEKVTTCGYESCLKVDSSTLNVHVIPHSHDDVGWKKTVSQYYYGSQTNLHRAGVQYIIGSVIEALQSNPERRFIQVETAFFNMWWNNQDEATKNAVRELINNGQLEIAGGAWSMNDEAATHYQSTIDQFTVGLKMVNDALGPCSRTKVGWQIDPFGHSREMASLFAQMGFDAFFFTRLHYRDRDERLKKQTMEMLWRGSSSLGNASDIFTVAMYDHYNAPGGFCFDVLCSDDPIVDNEDSPEYNYEDKVKSYANYIKQVAPHYKTSNILITMGADFHYQDAHSYFFNMDKLIKGFEKFQQTYNDKIINVFYSTPSCYVKAVNDEASSRNLTFDVKTDDFFPYASDSHSYWTGYYTSRPTSKRYERLGNNILQVGKQLTAFVGDGGEKLQSLKESLGVLQHHDAITGTEKQAVANDYHRMVSIGIAKSADISSSAISNLLKKGDAAITINWQLCLLSNVSYCPTSSQETFLVNVYNPLSRTISHYVHLPVPSTDFTILDSNGELVDYQVSVAIDNFNYTGFDTQPFNLVFLATDLPPLGMKVYRVWNNDPSGDSPYVQPDTSQNRFILGDVHTGIHLDSISGEVISMTINNQTKFVNQKLMYYESSGGDNSNAEHRASGAYIFRPNSEALSFGDTLKEVTVYRGILFDEVHQVFGDWAKQIIRVYRKEQFIEFDWLVGPIDDSDSIGKEIISRFTTEINSEDTFYTDSNGRETIQRTRNYFPTFDFTNEEPISANYYPVTSKIMIKDDETQFAVLNDRAQGGSSLSSGEIEIMVHRRLLHDDAKGVEESLSETQYGQGLVARGQHYVTFGSPASSAVERDVAQRKLLAPLVFVADVPEEDVEELINFEFAGLLEELPSNVHILTLEPWDENSVLLRFEHIMERGEDPKLSNEVTLVFQDLFATFTIQSVQEMTLAANELLEESERLKWTEGAKSFAKGRAGKISREQLIVDLSPMQIKTFVAAVTYKH